MVTTTNEPNQNALMLPELSVLCRQGRLFDVQEWCKQGKPVHFQLKNPCLTPIGIAIDKGFHSLVEVFLQNGVPADGTVLWQAVRRGKSDLVELLFRYGADVNSISFSDVILTENAEIVRMFIDRGADVSDEYMIARLFVRSTRSMIHVLKPYKENPSIHFQATMALRHFCQEGDVRGVSLLLWFGADPRLKVPLTKKDHEETWYSPLVDAIWNGHLEIVKKIKIDPKFDDVNELMPYASMSKRAEMVELLVGLGADPNLKSDSQVPIQWVLWSLSCSVGRLDSYSPFKSPLNVFKTLIRLGAKMVMEETEIKCFRKCLLAMKPMHTYELIKELKQTGFTDKSGWLVILNHPKLRQHLGLRTNAMMQMFPGLNWTRRKLSTPRVN